MGLFDLFKKKKRTNFHNFPSCPQCGTQATPDMAGPRLESMSWNCPECGAHFVNPVDSEQQKDLLVYFEQMKKEWE